jgi:telomeric repeat-binding factor 2
MSNMNQVTKLCKHCKTEIPKNAKVCPNCRKKQGGIWKWIAIVILVFVIIGFASNGDDNEQPKITDTGDSSEVGKKSTEESLTSDDTNETTAFKQGETAELNGVQVTLTNSEESNGGDFNKPSDGNVFILAEFEIANNTDKELAISSMLSFEAYADDYTLNYSAGAIIDIDGTQLDGTIAPGKKMKGWIGWEVPKDYKNVEIHFTDNVWSNNKFIFLIEND